MRISKRLCLLLALACAGAQKTAEPPGRDGRKLMVVGINDTHGGLLAIPPPKSLAAVTKSEIGGADWFAGWMNAIRADYASRGDEMIILDAGDEFQGSLISNQFRGKSVVDAYNASGVAAAAVGNHDFDFGVPVLQERMAESKYPWLIANVFLKGTRTRPQWARPSVLLNVGGIQLGLIGVITAESPLIINSVLISDLEFAPGAPFAAAEADALRGRGATVVILVAHAGPLPPDEEIEHIAEACKGKVDAVVSGHHHVVLGPPPLIVANIPIVQSGWKLQNFSTIELTLDAKNHVKSYAVNEGNTPKNGGPQAILHTLNGQSAQFRGHKVEPDGRVAAILESYDAQVKKLRDRRLGETAVELRKGGKDDLLGNLTADALRSGAGGGLVAQFAFQNSGGLRISEIPRGPITYGQIFDLYPFDNQQVVLSLSANQVRDALEVVLHAGKPPLRVSGLRYTVDGEKVAAKDVKDAPPGALVTKVVDESGKALCETKTCNSTGCDASCAPGSFTVALTDFLANGGDGLVMLKELPRQVGSVLARDIIVAYVKAHQPLTPQLLGSGQQRVLQTGPARRAQTGE